MTRSKTVGPVEVERPLLLADDAAFDGMPSEPGSAPEALDRLAATRERGRLPHALLVAGPVGSGKRWLATRLAQLLACTSPDVERRRPCLRCAECLRTEKGLDTDVMLLELPFDERRGERKSEIPVEHVRAMQEQLSFRSAGRRRVVILDPADRLSDVAGEAVLKTLEEPPAGVTLLLLTSRPSFFKPTIRSRAQLVRVGPPSPASLAAVLRARRGLSEQDAGVVARLSGGDVRRAHSLDPAEVAEKWVSLARALYEILGPGPKGERRARDLALEVVPPKSEDPTGGGREELAAFLSLLERILRDALVSGTLGAESPGGAGTLARDTEPDVARLGNPGAVKAARGLATRLGPDAAAQALAAVEEARDDLALYMNARVVLTHLLLVIHSLRSA